MNIKQTVLPKSQIELVFTLTPADYEQYAHHAAEKISNQQTFAGFRPGKAPFEIVKKQVGEIPLMQATVELLVPKVLARAIVDKKIKSVGQPEVNLEKMAPGNDIIFKAIISIVPEITLVDWHTITVEKKPVVIEEKQIDVVIEDSRKGQAKEVRVNRASQKTDKLHIDMDTLLANVPIEGGQAKNHHVYLNEKHYIPGFPEELVGLSENDEKSFSLPFPKDHYQKNLAGKQVDFKVKVKGVFETELPPADDTLAEKMGQKTLVELRALIKTNLTFETEQKEAQRAEIELFDKILSASKIGELPEILIESERQKMIAELRARIEEIGMEFEKYLEQIKKTTDELGKEFTTQAEKRAKLALFLRAIARNEKITFAAEELNKELDAIKIQYTNHPNIEERLKSADIREYVASTIVNRKVMDLLRGQIK
ncbi:MAG TPA: trigger factor [Candidatus Magasanikbacteria bacterium]|nr:trigger factor [Candidatus Magasanikbacteria bacterium]